VGEAALLDRFLGSGTGGPGLVLGPGDDAAIWRPPPGGVLALTQDAVVEGVDFRREWTRPHAVGRRAVAVCLSDLAAMGAEPVWCMASLCAPPGTRVDDAAAIHLGIAEAAEAAGCRLVGGDVSSIDGPLVVDVSAGGTVAEDRVLRRDAGRAGDALLVTGTLGRAAAGLRLMRGDVVAAPAESEVWRQALLDPRPRLDEGRHLAALGVRCAGDLSDGLLVDAGRTALASGCAAELWLDHIPVDDDLRSVFGDQWPELALGGGEDFELLAAAPAELVPGVVAEWPARLAPLTIVGRLLWGRGVVLLDGDGGSPLPLPPVASRHFG